MKSLKDISIIENKYMPQCRGKETIITPSITPNKAPAAMVKIVGTKGKTNLKILHIK